VSTLLVNEPTLRDLEIEKVFKELIHEDFGCNKPSHTPDRVLKSHEAVPPIPQRNIPSQLLIKLRKDHNDWHVTQNMNVRTCPFCSDEKPFQTRFIQRDLTAEDKPILGKSSKGSAAMGVFQRGYMEVLSWKCSPFYISVASGRGDSLNRLRQSNGLLGKFVRKYEAEITVESLPRTVEQLNQRGDYVQGKRAELGWKYPKSGCRWERTELEMILG
jgi:hypothetical protein